MAIPGARLRQATYPPGVPAPVDYGRAYGGVVQVPLYSAAAVAPLPQTRPHVDWRQVRRTAPGHRSPLAALQPAAPADDTAFLAEVARIARVGRAAVVVWRRNLPGFPEPVAGTDVHPRFDRRAIDTWLLAHDKLTVPHTLPTAVLSVTAAAFDALRVRLADPELRPGRRRRRDGPGVRVGGAGRRGHPDRCLRCSVGDDRAAPCRPRGRSGLGDG
ncbi:hypothetical protein [Streptomyces sp. NPDC058701]|uniref:hypothetical protein n=1 Tax=Streptomyces sp. NPDC058701 TaxID=3346608 RepID=UPI00364FFA0A